MAANRCQRCHRLLKDPVSIAIGMGPECRGALSKKGWKFPRPRWGVEHGRPVLLGVVGKIEPPKGGTEKRKVKHGDGSQSKS